MMKNTTLKKHEDTKAHSASKIGLGFSGGFFVANRRFLDRKPIVSYGASGMADGSPNLANSRDETPSVMTDRKISIGLSERNLAVRMMVMIKETLRFPRSVMFPNVVFLKRTAFLIPCSARLFVGLTAGCFRKTSSSSLWVIRRLRKLSDSLCVSGSFSRSFLNLLRIFFLAERNSSTVRLSC